MSSGGNFLDTLLEVGVRVQDNGTTQPAEGTINFIGFTVADDPSNGRTNVTNPAGAFAFGLDLATVTSTTQHVVGWYGEPLDAATMSAPGNAYLPLYSGTSAEWKAVAMSGDVVITAAGATTVDAIQGVAISGAASTNYALIATGTGAATWQAQMGGSGITALTGDVTASGSGSVAATVVGITGTAGTAAITATNLQAVSANSSLVIGTNKAGATLNLQADAATPALTLTAPSGHAWAQIAGTGTDTLVAMGPLAGSESTYSSFYLLRNGVAPSPTNYTLVGEGSSTYVNAPNSAGSVYLRAAGTTAAQFSQTGASIGTTTGANTVIGSLKYTTRTVTASFTVDTTTTDYIILADTTSAAIAVTLPAPTNGRMLTIIDKSNTWATNNMTLTRHGTEKIDGTAASVACSVNGTRLQIWSDGTDWYTMSSLAAAYNATGLGATLYEVH